MGMFGPDRDQDIVLGWAFAFSLDSGYGANLTFSSSAGYEQALIIYREPTWENVIEKGTYQPLRNLNPASLPRNGGGAPVVYRITGWYKGDPQLRGWRQSQYRAFVSDGVHIRLGFDDARNDLDFDDIVVSITRIYIPAHEGHHELRVS